MIQLLLIEDCEQDYSIFKRHLETSGESDIAITWVQSLEQAVERLEKDTYQLIISDLGLPDGTGIESLDLLLKLPGRTPLIVITGDEDESLLDKASAMGIYDCLVKSDVNPRLLRRSIRYTLKRFESELEREKIEKQLRHSQRVDSLGQLTGGIAHDFNNKLAILSATLEVLRRTLQNDPDSERCLETLDKTIRKSADLTRQLLAFGRKQELEKKNIDLRKTITESLKLLERILRSNITVTKNISNEVLSSEVDETQIDQILMNLLINAQDAIGAQPGQIQVNAKTVELSQTDTPAFFQEMTKKFVQISITDTGCGMTEEQKNRAIEPFFSTKNLAQGTGLGLSVVDGIINQHGGFLEFESQYGQGTTVTVYLPWLEAVDSQRKNEEKLAEPATALCTVLYAEDEPELRELTVSLIESSGLRVLASKNGAEAFELFKTYQKDIDVVLTDVVMPQTGGKELFVKIRALAPTMGVIFVSGYSQAELTAEGGHLPEYTRFLPKPCDVNQLVEELLSLAQCGRQTQHAS